MAPHRDSGFVAGALLAGFAADTLGTGSAIALVAGLTGASGLWVALTQWQPTADTRVRLRRWLRSSTSCWPMRAHVLRSDSNGQPSKGGG